MAFGSSSVLHEGSGESPSIILDTYTNRSSHSKAHTRNYDLFSPIMRGRVVGQQEITNSILDSIWCTLTSGKKPILPDGFERFLRDSEEVTLADIYHVLSEQAADNFQGLFWFAVLQQGLTLSELQIYLKLTVKEDHGNLEVSPIPAIQDAIGASVSEFFDLVRRGIQEAPPKTLRLWYFL